MNCMHVKIKWVEVFGPTHLVGIPLAVLRREFTPNGRIVYWVCDDIGKLLGKFQQIQCEVVHV